MSAEQLAGLTADELPPELQQYAEPAEEQQEQQEEQQQVTEQREEVKPDPLLEKALKGGWTDKDAWVEAGKDPDLWVDAKEFVSRAPLYEKTRELKKALREEKERSQKVAEYAAKVAETTRNKVLAELEEQRLKAVEIGDIDGFKEAEQQIEKVRKESPEMEVQQQAETLPEIPAEVTDFAERNAKWFEKDEDMTDLMVSRTRKYTANGQPLGEALKQAEADVKRAFAHKFENPNKQRPGAVGSGNKEERPNTVTHADLNSEERQVWSALKKTGMSFDQFVAGLKEQGRFK